MTSSLPKSPRYVFIDAWRGVAALAVLFHHLLHTTVMEVTLRRILPKPVLLLSDIASYRIPIFMILSGFVIAHSLRNNPLTKESLGNFTLRRHLRLDPLYWLIILVVLVLQFAESLMPGAVVKPFPNAAKVFLNFIYLQHLTNVGPIVNVAWTLCIEIQFYVAFTFLLVLGKWIAKNKSKESFETASTLLVFVLGCFSLVFIHFVTQKAYFTHYWQYFAAGALCWGAIHRPRLRWIFFAFMFCLGLSMTFSPLSPFFPQLENVDANTSAPAMLAGLLLSLLIYGVGLKGKLTTSWNHPLIQYFGRISYSLYLIHLPIVLTVMRVGYKITGTNHIAALVWFLLSALISIAFAHLLYLWVEKPSMKMASRFKPKSEAPIAPPEPKIELAETNSSPQILLQKSD